MGELLKVDWNLIFKDPGPFIVFFLIGGLIGYGLKKLLSESEVKTLQQRLALAQENVARLEGEKGELLKGLAAHGEDIAAIKAHLERGSGIWVMRDGKWRPVGAFRRPDA